MSSNSINKSNKLNLEPYDSAYKSQVIACIKRNFPWLGTLSTKEIGDWLENIVEYKWIDMELINDIPFSHGAVVLNNGNVVGFFGLIYSQRNLDDTVIELNTTTWVIDEEYRDSFFLLRTYKKLFTKNLFVTDFSAIPSVRPMNEKFGINLVDSISYRFFRHFYCNLKEDIAINFNIDSIPDSILSKELDDHKKYGVKCVEISENKRKGYLFYHVVKRKYFGFNLRWIEILKCTDTDLFSSKINKIVDALTKHECLWQLRCDSHFLSKAPNYNGKMKTEEACIMTRSFISKEKVDYLYSEISMVDLYAGSDVTIKKLINKIVRKIRNW